MTNLYKKFRKDLIKDIVTIAVLLLMFGGFIYGMIYILIK